MRYSVVENGTSVDRIMLWDASLPLVEVCVDLEGGLPKVSLVGDCGAGEVIEAQFKPVTHSPLNLRSAGLSLMRAQPQGWLVPAVANERFFVLIDPSHHYRLILELEGEDLRVTVQNLWEEAPLYAATMVSNPMPIPLHGARAAVHIAGAAR